MKINDIQDNECAIGSCSCCEHSHSHEHSHEHGGGTQKTMIIRLVIGAVLLATGFFPIPFANIILLVSYAVLGYDILWRSVKNISKGNVFDENFLMALATIGALAIGAFHEAVAVMLFYQVGEMFQDMAVDKSRKSISDLMNIRPDFAAVKRNGEIEITAPENVKIGDIIVVKTGERVPLDGVVTEGKASVDMSALSGESVPAYVSAGDNVLSGSVNIDGLLMIEVKKEYKDSTVSRILELVENSASKKSQTEKFISVFARKYTPIVVCIALVLAFAVPFAIGQPFKTWLYRALIFLVVSCPCALVISVPLGFFGGIGRASKSGILIKGSNYLQTLSNLETVVFDKTGTLTNGTFSVTKVSSEENDEKLVEYAAYAEYYSNHPIGNAIKEYYGKEFDISRISDYSEVPGHGISVNVDGKKVLAGNKKHMDASGIECKEANANGSVVYIAVDGKFTGSIIISDTIKADSKKAIDALRGLNMKTVMLTGDHKGAAEAVGTEIGIDTIYSDLLPEDKVSRTEELMNNIQDGGKLAFVGDGINDAPVLARSDLGIAMGGIGSDAAIEAADVVIMNDEPSKIADAVVISKKTMSIVWQNIIFALSVKILIMALSVFGLSSMWLAIFADVGVSLIAVANSVRVIYIKLKN